MRHKAHTVWTWLDADSVVRFAGYGMYIDAHPAITRFAARFDNDSEVDSWLQSLDEEPKRETFGNDVISLGEAIGFTMGLRQKFAATILRSRGPASYSGGHPKRGVYKFDAEDVTQCAAFTSVRDAAKAVGCNPSTVTRWCTDAKNIVWGYLYDELDNPNP